MTPQDPNNGQNGLSDDYDTDSSLYGNESDQDYDQDYTEDYDDVDNGAGNNIEPYRKSFFQRNSNLIIWGGAALFAAVMGFVTFKDMILPPQQDSVLPPVAMTQENNSTPSAQQNPTGMEEVTPPAETTENNFPAETSLVPDDTAIPAPTSSDLPPATNGSAPFGSSETASQPLTPENSANNQTAPVENTAQSAAPLAQNSTEQPSGQVTTLQNENESLRKEGEKHLEEISQLREQLALAQSALSDAQSKKAAKPVQQSSDIAEKPVPSSEPKKSAAPRAATRKAESKTPRESTTRNARYELRSVSGNAAWISTSGSNELKRVAVGDTLDGIGQITSIREQNGTWIVQGTKGQIR